MRTATETISLCDYANDRDYTVLFWAGVGMPGGDYAPCGHPDLDFVERRDLLGLAGTVDESGCWNWDGQGNPRDDRGNSITKLQAYSDKAKWESIADEYEGDVRS